MVWRTSRMQRASDSSVTITLGQTALISSSLVTRRPTFSTRQRNTSKLLGRKSTSRSAVRRQPCAISSVYSPNWNIISTVLLLPLRFAPLISDTHARFHPISGKLHGSFKTGDRIYRKNSRRFNQRTRALDRDSQQGCDNDHEATLFIGPVCNRSDIDGPGRLASCAISSWLQERAYHG